MSQGRKVKKQKLNLKGCTVCIRCDQIVGSRDIRTCECCVRKLCLNCERCAFPWEWISRASPWKCADCDEHCGQIALNCHYEDWFIFPEGWLPPEMSVDFAYCCNTVACLQDDANICDCCERFACNEHYLTTRHDWTACESCVEFCSDGQFEHAWCLFSSGCEICGDKLDPASDKGRTCNCCESHTCDTCYGKSTTICKECQEACTPGELCVSRPSSSSSSDDDR